MRLNFMARMKPQALLLQSKKKKGPAKIGLKRIITCNLALIVVVLSLYAVYRHWYRRSSNLPADHSDHFEDPRNIVGANAGEAHVSGQRGHVILTTSKGSITVALNQDASHEVVDKFLAFCKIGHFNGMAFQRVIKHYVIQGGNVDILGTVEDWTSKDKSIIDPTTTRHEAFMLGTSKEKQDVSFPIFITTAPISKLNEKFVVFGQVIKGEDVVQEIEEVDTDELYRPKSPVTILDATLKQEP